ncbi:hypothetical protein PIB30_021931 [Stylosanthes scabra]|uniref:Uncharacterized protein n=1 Tax=Stylosanthes scabra TaxID=79078 RepID=A0ABU6U850_9FABA|nr:hypothetical protein [Stylosanthes scabra]
MVESIQTMDPDISRWFAEFQLRSSAPDSVVSKVLKSLNLSRVDHKLKKTFLLRILRSEINNASITETTLEIIEQLEAIDPNDAVPVFDFMRKAYCSVAVECTVKFLSATSDGIASTEYLSAVARIWRCRVVELERRKSKLFSDEIVQWRNDIEAAILDSRVFERLAKLNTRYDALSAVRLYLEKVWETMGPCFLESLAEMIWKDKKKNHNEKGLAIRVLDPVPETVAEGSGKDACRNSSGAGQRRDHSGNEKENENHNENVNDNDGAHWNEGVEMNGGHEGKEQMEERAKGSVDGDGTKEPAKGEKASEKGNPQLRRKLPAFIRCHKGVKISSAEELGTGNPRSKNGTEKGVEDISEAIGSKLAQKGINQEQPMENKSGDVDVPNSNTCGVNVLCQPNDAEKKSVHYSRVQVQHPNFRKQNITAHERPNFRKQNITAHESPNLRVQNRTAHESPNLREQNITAHSDEGNNSKDDLPSGVQLRRKKRKWSSLEEETLITAVKTYGVGNWATIQSFYKNIFQNRTAVDLKDKWRNMMR